MLHIVSLFFLAFLPLFVAIDAIGVLPMFWSLTLDLESSRKSRLISQACITALAVALIFLFAGKALFAFLGIQESDFRIAGGIVLLTIAIIDLAFSSQRPRVLDENSGVVPIGVPLMMGPAALTTIIISVDANGYLVTLASLLLNVGFTWFLFQKSHWVLRLLGNGGARAAGKLMHLFLAAIAVMMIRVGLFQILRG